MDLRPTHVTALVLFLSAALPLLADSGVWGERGVPRRFAMVHGFLVAADGRGVSVYDVSGTSIQRVSWAATSSESLDLSVAGDRIDVLTRAGAAHYTLSPTGFLHFESETGYEGGLRIASDASGFAVGGSSSFTMFNRDGTVRFQGRTSRPVQSLLLHRGNLLVSVERELVTMYSPSGAEMSVVALDATDMIMADGDLLVAGAGGQGLALVDVSNPQSPVVLQQVLSGETDLRRMAVAGDRIYAADSRERVRVFSAAGRSLRQVGTLEQTADAVFARGDRLFLSASSIDRFLVLRETGLPIRAFDTRDPAALREVAQFRDLAGPLSGVATDGTFAYVADPPFFRVLNISKPSEVKEVARIEVPRLQDRVRIRGNRAIVYGSGDVDYIDIADPYQPRLLGVYHSMGHPPANAAFAGDTVVEGNSHTGFHVLDFTSNPATPTIQSVVYWHWFDVVAHEDTVYLFALGEMRVVDVRNRLAAQEVRSVAVSAAQSEIAPATAAHPDLLLAYTLDGLRVYSLATPLDPRWIGTAAVPQGGTLSVSGDTAFVVTPSGSVRIDLTDPTRPAVTPVEMPVTAPLQSASFGEKVVVADRYGLRVYGPQTAAPTPPPVPPPDPVRRRPSRG